MDSKPDKHPDAPAQQAKADAGASGASLDPFEINFLPQFLEGRGPREPFVNEHGVLIGDHEYESPQSPLSQWTEHTDPFVMVGEQWVHPFKDIGFHTTENRDYFEKGIEPSEGGVARYMHPDKSTAYAMDDAQDELAEQPREQELD